MPGFELFGDAERKEINDDFISKNISCLIKLSWKEEEVQNKAKKMFETIKSVLK